MARRSGRPHNLARDAERSRQAILDAAERLFADNGYAATSMQAIGAEAGLARATPAYFFGSKDALYAQVLRRVHEARSEAIRAACAPLREWVSDPGAGHAALREAAAVAVDGYMSFLERRPSFARLIDWEALTDASRLPADVSTSFSETLREVHAVRRERGLREFDVDTLVVALVSLCFLPIAHSRTFEAGGRIDTRQAGFARRYRAQVTDIVTSMLVDN
jgi:TetR/AcrR family transcriptional regulator